MKAPAGRGNRKDGHHGLVVIGPVQVPAGTDLGSGAAMQLVVRDPDGNNWAIQEIRERVGAALG